MEEVTQKRAALCSIDCASMLVLGLEVPSSHSSLGRLLSQAAGKDGSRYSSPVRVCVSVYVCVNDKEREREREREREQECVCVFAI